MNENQNLLADNDDFDDLNGLFAQFDGVALEGGVDAADEEDNCAGGACKIWGTYIRLPSATLSKNKKVSMR